MKTISFVIPCYNSSSYMDNCINHLVSIGDDIEILIIDDGSDKDDTLQKALAWQEKHPDIIRAIHKENGGHGSAINTGLSLATGLYFKVVDSDDYIKDTEFAEIADYAREQVKSDDPIDLIIYNYVYDKPSENAQNPMRYTDMLPTDKVFSWNDLKNVGYLDYITMHSVMFKTQLLKDCGLQLPEHCFYVDNIFVYYPLVHAKTIRYFNKDIYMYFIGRDDQSVNENVFKQRIDQQIRITKIMFDAIDLQHEVPYRKLRIYMRHYLSMMTAICAVFLYMINTEESIQKNKDLWAYFKEQNPGFARYLKSDLLNRVVLLPGRVGRAFVVFAYRVVHEFFHFN
ncbi:MAG: glycosyltransferase family 2 protein [Eggerthellaceae bacterium]|nr:glycosyltransferase family 2 protein [Eggerthellaceae bacterium]